MTDAVEDHHGAPLDVDGLRWKLAMGRRAGDGAPSQEGGPSWTGPRPSWPGQLRHLTGVLPSSE